MKAIVALSGGMDSATVLAKALEEEREVLTYGFYYGAKHNYFENRAAVSIANHYEVPFQLLDLATIMVEFKSTMMLNGGDIPEGHYEAENMRQTVVPCRNLIFISLLSGLALSRGANEVWLGVHAGDHYIYPDCRPAFLTVAEETVRIGNDTRDFHLRAPFLHKTKVEILRYGLNRKVPYQLTRTCYKHQEQACGKCGSCQERLAAFRELGCDDPLAYDTRELMAKA